MNLLDIANNSSVFLDANILIYAAERRSNQCRQLLEDCDQTRIHACSTTVILAEFCHRHMINEAKAKGLVQGSNPSKLMSEKRSTITKLDVYANSVCALLDSAITFEVIHPQDFYVALELQRQHGLLTNDSLNLAVAKRLGINKFATADKNFDHIQGLIVYKPSDIH